MMTENRSNYSENTLRNELSVVFSSVCFADKREQHIVSDGYFLNIHNLTNYAVEHGIDEMEYIRSIRAVLLKSPRIYEKY